MAVPVIVIDGSMPYGSFLMTASNGQSYIVDNFTPNRPSTGASDNKITGAPNRQRTTAGFDTFSCTLQAPQGTSGWPKFGDYFNLLYDDNYGSETWYFDPITTTLSNDPGAVRKINCTGKKAYNGNPTAVAAS